MNFGQMLSLMASTIQSTCSLLYNFTIGSLLRALIEANASVALFNQAQALEVLALTRASTSSGADLDSFMADFGITRLPAVAASGTVTFTRFSAGLAAFIQVGATVQTADGTQTFAVTADPTNPAFSAAQNGYNLAAGVLAITVPVAAATAGSGGNVAAGSITSISTPIAAIDTVTNAAAFANGLDAETDTALRTRFVAFIASLSKATRAAVAFAVTSVQQGLTYTLVENYDYPGITADLGNFFVVVDDGSGAPSNTLLTKIFNAIDAVRPLCSRFTVNSPTVVNATIVLTITAAAGYVKAQLTPIVQAAIAAYVNSLPLGASLSFYRIAQVAYDASPGVALVSAVTLNGGAADLAASQIQVIKATAVGAVTVN